MEQDIKKQEEYNDMLRELDPDQAYLLLAYYDKINKTNQCSYLTWKDILTLFIAHPLLPIKRIFILLGIGQPWKWRI